MMIGKTNEAFTKLRRISGSPPVLASLDETQPFFLSPNSIGTVITQKCGERDRPAAFSSWQVQSVKQKYGRCEKAVVTVYWAVLKHKYLTRGQIVFVMSHHTLP